MRKISMKKKAQSNENEDDNDQHSNAEEEEMDRKEEDEDQEDDVNDKNDGNSPHRHHSKKSKKKGGKRNRKSGGESSNGTGNADEQFEVEAILNEKLIRGVRHFLIRWKGYGSNSNTWEPEDVVNSPDLIAKFLKSKKSDDSPSTSKKNKKRTSGSGKQAKKSKRNNGNEGEDSDDEGPSDAEYEVDRIIEVHHKKNGKREFLVHWKGYTLNDNTWEPEENMSCPELIKKFMDKVEKARETDTRELRVDRKPTNPFTLSMATGSRRLSRRNLGKQRKQYHDNE